MNSSSVQAPLPVVAPSLDYDRAALELLRAIRGKRSQVLFARRLGYRANPITDWERGVRQPTAREVLRAAQRVRLNVNTAFERLGTLGAPRQDAQGQWQLHEWLVAFCQGRSIVWLAESMQLTRHTVGRWLAGKAHPKLAQFLRLLDVISGRAHDWVAGLVAIESVPTLLPTFRQAQAARNIAFEQPWTEVILRALETTAYREQPELVHTTLAACLGISQAELDSALSGLVDAGILQSSEGGYQVLRELSVDTRVSSDAFGKLQQHWLKVALDRSRRTGTADWFAYNVISLSKADLATVHECLRRAYRETRSIVAASQPCETAALLLMQLVRFT